MLTKTEQQALARHVFRWLNHGHVNLDGTTVPRHDASNEPDDGRRVADKCFQERLPLQVTSWPEAEVEFRRLCDVAGLDLDVALT